MLAEIYINQEFLREAILVVLGKILRELTKSVKIFDHVVDSFLYGSNDKKGTQL